jgi:hypothetical protein
VTRRRSEPAPDDAVAAPGEGGGEPEPETDAQRNLRLLQERFGAPQPRAPLPGQPSLFEPGEPDGGGGEDASSKAKSTDGKEARG